MTSITSRYGELLSKKPAITRGLESAIAARARRVQTMVLAKLSGDEGSIELSAPPSETVSPPEPDEAGPLSGTQPLRRSTRLGSSAAPAAAPGASLLAGTLNLLNTVVGGGILSLPFAFKSCGLLAGVLYQLVFGAMSWYGCYLLLDCLQHAKTATSFEALAQAAFGRAGFLAYNLAALVNCYGACVSYVIVVGDVLEPLCQEMGLPLCPHPYPYPYP